MDTYTENLFGRVENVVWGGDPVVTDVSPDPLKGTETITITGSGFGSQPWYVYLEDISSWLLYDNPIYANSSAIHASVRISASSWSNTQIVVNLSTAFPFLVGKKFKDPEDLNGFVPGVSVAVVRKPSQELIDEDVLLQKYKDTPSGQGYYGLVSPGTPPHPNLEYVPLPQEFFTYFKSDYPLLSKLIGSNEYLVPYDLERKEERREKFVCSYSSSVQPTPNASESGTDLQTHAGTWHIAERIFYSDGSVEETPCGAPPTPTNPTPVVRAVMFSGDSGWISTKYGCGQSRTIVTGSISPSGVVSGTVSRKAIIWCAGSSVAGNSSGVGSVTEFIPPRTSSSNTPFYYNVFSGIL